MEKDLYYHGGTLVDRSRKRRQSDLILGRSDGTNCPQPKILAFCYRAVAVLRSISLSIRSRPSVITPIVFETVVSKLEKGAGPFLFFK
jgi:hypothetical protein